jgi:hypothetical protein
MKSWIRLMMLALALTAPTVALAHEGHAHKVMGTIESIDGKNLQVKTTDGKTVMVMLDAKTKITQGTTALQPSALKVGDRLVAEGAEANKMITAATIKVGAATTPAVKPKK